MSRTPPLNSASAAEGTTAINPTAMAPAPTPRSANRRITGTRLSAGPQMEQGVLVPTTQVPKSCRAPGWHPAGAFSAVRRWYTPASLRARPGSAIWRVQASRFEAHRPSREAVLQPDRSDPPSDRWDDSGDVYPAPRPRGRGVFRWADAILARGGGVVL